MAERLVSRYPFLLQLSDHRPSGKHAPIDEHIPAEIVSARRATGLPSDQPEAFRAASCLPVQFFIGMVLHGDLHDRVEASWSAAPDLARAPDCHTKPHPSDDYSPLTRSISDRV